jgi:hypothetical protein
MDHVLEEGGEAEMEWVEKDLAEVDLVELEEAYCKKELQSIPLEQL